MTVSCLMNVRGMYEFPIVLVGPSVLIKHWPWTCASYHLSKAPYKASAGPLNDLINLWLADFSILCRKQKVDLVLVCYIRLTTLAIYCWVDTVKTNEWAHESVLMM